jgi:hypothetical protein
VDFAVGSQTVPGLPVADKTYEAELDLTGLDDGDHPVTATALGLLGETATAGVGIVVDRLPPAPPDAQQITAEESDAGFAIVQGLPGAVERRTGLDTIRVEVTNPATGAVVTAVAAQDGSFSARLLALLGAELQLVAIDAVGNRSTPTVVVVERRSVEGGVPLNGLALWVRAADLDEPDEVDPETGAVLLWRDRSVNQNHLAAANASARPSRTLDDGGRAVVRFDGGDDTVRFTTRLTTIRTVFWVVSSAEVTGGASWRRSLLGDDSSTYAWLGERLARNDLGRSAAIECGPARRGSTAAWSTPVGEAAASPPSSRW